MKNKKILNETVAKDIEGIQAEDVKPLATNLVKEKDGIYTFEAPEKSQNHTSCMQQTYTTEDKALNE